MIVRAPSSSTRLFGEPLDRLGEGARLLVLPDRHELGGGARVVDAHDVLLDDRALVEVARDEVRGRADELHPAGVRLLVGVRALEAGQEGVVDVDDAAAELRRRAPARGSACSARARPARCRAARPPRARALSKASLLRRGSSPGAPRTARRRTRRGRRGRGGCRARAGSRTGSWPARWRNSRSLRQWAAVETSTRVRSGRPTTSSCQRHPVLLGDRARARPRMPCAAAADSTCRRMKKVPVSSLENCCDSVMLPRGLDDGAADGVHDAGPVVADQGQDPVGRRLGHRISVPGMRPASGRCAGAASPRRSPGPRLEIMTAAAQHQRFPCFPAGHLGRDLRLGDERVPADRSAARHGARAAASRCRRSACWSRSSPSPSW